MALIAYGLDGIEPALSSPVSRAIFSIAKPNLDSSRESVISGKRGGRPKQKPPFSENENPPFQNSKTNKNKELELEEEKKKKDIGADKPPKHPRFVPPTLEEVTSYIQERGSRVDPQGFIDFYASKGWMIGKTPMKDWKAACRNTVTSFVFLRGSPRRRWSLSRFRFASCGLYRSALIRDLGLSGFNDCRCYSLLTLGIILYLRRYINRQNTQIYLHRYVQNLYMRR